MTWQEKDKTCRICGDTKKGIEFGICNKTWENLRDRCKVCRRAYDRSRIAAGTKRKQVYKPGMHFWYRVKNLFGITREQYEAILDRQNGRCALCRRLRSETKGFSIDHDHSCCPARKSCGKCIRGILCLTCNSAIGHFREDVLVMQRAIQYLGQNAKPKPMPGAQPNA